MRGSSPKQTKSLFDTAGSSIFNETYTYEVPNPGGGITVTWYRIEVRAYRKCASFEGGKGNVGVRFYEEADTAFTVSAVAKTRNNPRDLVPF